MLCYKHGIKIKSDKWSMTVHACDPSYSAGRDQEDNGSRLALVKSNETPSISTNKVEVVVHIIISATREA
jgi:hypothetical protein